ncbi:hypothetical protein G6F46_008861 [Rhizopus delemar]|uniref:DHHA2 domain-containing protein n=3 Tax=Rhizopus TaxID=4842 RepID=I1BVV5_RHIO9|nr:hypothetical protein RO3G_05040 [Rhizopus delemar RA 99-880]KAG1447292.1 hypothetical protein G6F55_011172 [Rhizopus delemar]KAG1535242.1 hypothetical protein G6F51_011646 [Rhizopus arrhizus]KAG1494387.1 hypothetical protein G6F54_007910 [Rhizopus delemar]KAG1500022.1 hypothetical protein G6F53_011395 [Rhizopus delemar]|eukprot:EIE80335.1 hypothetical protein RO3G_05040 [Rhizopus delemar RA 99-880]
MSSLNEFLNQLHNSLSKKPRVIVSGNDSADLDSIISSLLFAYFSHQQDPDKIYIPVVKVPRNDLELRPELKYVFEQVGLDYHQLVCLEEIPKMGELVLIDHNHATEPFQDWPIVGVLDHHVDEGLYKTIALRRIEMVGSCVSLVLDHFPHVSLDTTVARLAAAPLLVDTVNLRWELGRTKELDVHTLDRLKPAAGDLEGYFEAIEKVKSQVDKMSTTHILRRDYKQFQVGPYRIGTSAVTWHFQGWFEREKGSEPITATALAFAKERDLDLEIIFTAFDHGQGNYKRQLAVFILNDDLLPLKKAIEESKEIQLAPIIEGCYYEQGNVRMSRKQVWPWVKQWIEGII